MSDRLRTFVKERWPNCAWHREWSVEHVLDGGTRLRGAADLALETTEGFVVIDHKRFPSPGGDKEHARAFAGQLHAYAGGIEAARKRPTLGTLVHFPRIGRTERWDTPTHETGHSFHVQALQEDNFPGLSCGCIAGDNGCFNPNGHIIDQPSNERCATTEGFAHYVHAVSWWSPNNSLSRPTKNGKSIEGGTTTTNSNCSVNSEIELEIARTFWDYDDANNEADMPSPGVGADPVNGTTTTIINGWTNFVDGFGNHQSDEDEDDPEEDWPENALNMQDYVFNVSDGQNFADSMSHNATQCVSTL